ncbi:uncharacterized protein LOC125208134 [Salvia hispanica]|uniref:uncharacterized protein LOC125208134 n=1 Tax=Salvia hispanica TaxID=49212 RepID=UPI00200978BD|nr:uncharacterized protein LOC125208134 [Salvia hispanica]
MNYCFEEKFETQYPQPIDQSMFASVEETVVVDELMQILVECVKQADVRGQELLLRKFFFEIEKEIPLQGFLVDRLKHSKISSLFHSDSACSDDFFQSESEVMSSRELIVEEEEEETSKKPERFKVKTVQVGGVVKEETTR